MISIEQSGHLNLLHKADLMSILGELTAWRIDSFIRSLEAGRRKGRVLPFVRGLRLSAHVIYETRKHLSNSNLKADWGHLLDSKGYLCSPECDVIIHRNGIEGQWNGKPDQIMDFKFIRQDAALVVISCKSFLRTSKVDEVYCKNMKEFVDKIWLFAECCGPRSAENIEKKALDAGYEKFWYLYKWSKQMDPDPNTCGWIEFINEVKKLN